MPHKVIITCAVTGSIHTPSMSPYLPVTPEEIAKESIAAAEAGAAILHLHARDPEDGSPRSLAGIPGETLRPLKSIDNRYRPPANCPAHFDEYKGI